MTDDQMFMVALLTALLPTAASVIGALQGRQTHKLVDGMSKRRVRQARAQGVSAGVRAQSVVGAPPPSTNVLLR